MSIPALVLEWLELKIAKHAEELASERRRDMADTTAHEIANARLMTTYAILEKLKGLDS